MKVWVLIVNHRYDDTIEVYLSYDGALSGLYKWVLSWWAQEKVPGLPVQGDKQATIDRYFEHMEGREWYRLGQTEVRQ